MLNKKARRLIEAVPLCGPRTADHLELIGVRTFEELAGADAQELRLRVNAALGRPHINSMGVRAFENLIAAAKAHVAGTKKPRAAGKSRRAASPRSARRKAVTYETIRKLALSLDLPGVSEGVSWGQPCLKAHGKLWTWWSPHENAPVFKVSFDERDMLIEADPDTFFFTAHYRNHPLVLVRPERLDLDWARTNLIRVWRAQAPKRLLKAFDAEAGGA